MRTTIAKTLMKRDGITEDEANEIVRDLKREFDTLVDDECLTQAMEIMYQVGLEPDYLDEIVDWQDVYEYDSHRGCEVKKKLAIPKLNRTHQLYKWRNNKGKGGTLIDAYGYRFQYFGHNWAVGKINGSWAVTELSTGHGTGSYRMNATRKHVLREFVERLNEYGQDKVDKTIIKTRAKILTSK